MAKKVNRPAQSWSYTLVTDRELPPEEQSRFMLRPLSHEERAAVRDEISRVQRNPDGTRTLISHSRRQSLEIVLSHVVSIENFPAGESQTWPAEDDARRKYLEMLHDDWVQELANEVWDKSTIDDSVKNS